MKIKFLLLLSFIILSYTGFSQCTSWERSDTCRVNVIVDKCHDITLSPESNPKFDDFLNILVKDKEFTNIEEVRTYLADFEFKTVLLELDGDNLIFHFEKVTRETFTLIKDTDAEPK